MPRFYFHARDRMGHIPDSAGVELENRAAARRYAVEAVRSIVADDVRRGHLALDGHVDVTDHDGRPIFTLRYAEAFHSMATGKRPRREVENAGMRPREPHRPTERHQQHRRRVDDPNA